MVEMVHDRIAAGETTVVSTAAVESKWKNYHITTFPGQSLSKTGLSLEEAMDLSRDRIILELDPGSFYYGSNILLRAVLTHRLVALMFSRWRL
jgi:hypothetical protein